MCNIHRLAQCISILYLVCTIICVECDTKGWYKKQVGIITSSIVTKDNKLLVGTLQGVVALLDTENGDIIWRNTSEPGHYIEDVHFVSANECLSVKSSKYEKKLDNFLELESVSVYDPRDGHLHYYVEKNIVLNEQINKVFNLDEIEETEQGALFSIGSDVLLLDSAVVTSNEGKKEDTWLILLTNSYAKLVNLDNWTTYDCRLELGNGIKPLRLSFNYYRNNKNFMVYDGVDLKFNVVLMGESNFSGYLTISFSLLKFYFTQKTIMKPYFNAKAIRCLHYKASETTLAQLYEVEDGFSVVLHWMERGRVNNKVFDLGRLDDVKFGDGYSFVLYLKSEGYKTMIIQREDSTTLDGNWVYSNMDDLFLTKDKKLIKFKDIKSGAVSTLQLEGNIEVVSSLVHANVYEFENEEWYLFSFNDGIVQLYKGVELQWERDESLSLVVSSIPSSYYHQQYKVVDGEVEVEEGSLFNIYVFDFEEVKYCWHVLRYRAKRFLKYLRLFLLNKFSFEKYKVPFLDNIARDLLENVGPNLEEIINHKHYRYEHWRRRMPEEEKKKVSTGCPFTRFMKFLKSLTNPNKATDVPEADEQTSHNKGVNDVTAPSHLFPYGSRDILGVGYGESYKDYEDGVYMVMMTSIGKLFCMNERGDLLWTKLVTELMDNYIMGPSGLIKSNVNGNNRYGYKLNASVTGRMVQESVLMYGNGKNCTIYKAALNNLVTICTGHTDSTTHVKWIDILDGTVLSEEELPFIVKYSMPLWNEYDVVLSNYILLADDDHVEVISGGLESPDDGPRALEDFLNKSAVIVVMCEGGGVYKGFRVMYDEVRGRCYYKYLWRINFTSNMNVIAIGIQEHRSVNTTPVVVMVDLNAYQRYITPHSLVVVTRHHDGFVMLHVINTLSGNIIYEEFLDPDLSDPIHITFHDNTIELYYWNSRQLRYVLHTVDLIYHKRLSIMDTLFRYYKSNGKGTDIDDNSSVAELISEKLGQLKDKFFKKSESKGCPFARFFNRFKATATNVKEAEDDTKKSPPTEDFPLHLSGDHYIGKEADDIAINVSDKAKGTEGEPPIGHPLFEDGAVPPPECPFHQYYKMLVGSDESFPPVDSSGKIPVNDTKEEPVGHDAHTAGLHVDKYPDISSELQMIKSGLVGDYAAPKATEGEPTGHTLFEDGAVPPPECPFHQYYKMLVDSDELPQEDPHEKSSGIEEVKGKVVQRKVDESRRYRFEDGSGVTPESSVPISFVRDFVLPYDARVMGVSTTRENVTDKSLLLATFDHQIVSIPKIEMMIPHYQRGGYVEDEDNLGYRLANRYFTMDVDESFNKTKSIYMNRKDFLQYDLQNFNTRGIMSASMRLESTSLVLYYGLDLTLVHVQPSGNYDNILNLHHLHYIYVLILGLSVVLLSKTYNNYKKSYIEHYECY